MSFRPMLRPGQGFKPFKVLRKGGGKTAKGRPTTSGLKPQGEFLGILSQADPEEKDQYKQRGTPITHTIVQRGTKNRAMANDILELHDPTGCCETRKFEVKGDPKDPGELGLFLVYKVEERDDLQ